MQGTTGTAQTALSNARRAIQRAWVSKAYSVVLIAHAAVGTVAAARGRGQFCRNCTIASVRVGKV